MTDKRSCRGTATVETALTIGLSLLLVLGTAQMAIIGYEQISADGAAFIAAHATVADPSAKAASVANSVFNSIPVANINASLGSGTAQATANRTVTGFPLMPGLASSYNVSGADVEYAPSPPPGNTPTFAFGASAVLTNYCVGSPCVFPSNYNIYLAQTIVPGGSGINGQFTEWACHDQDFVALESDFPATRPSPASIAGTALDMTTPGSTENNIYEWDDGSDDGAACDD